MLLLNGLLSFTVKFQAVTGCKAKIGIHSLPIL